MDSKKAKVIKTQSRVVIYRDWGDEEILVKSTNF